MLWTLVGILLVVVLLPRAVAVLREYVPGAVAFLAARRATIRKWTIWFAVAASVLVVAGLAVNAEIERRRDARRVAERVEYRIKQLRAFEEKRQLHIEQCKTEQGRHELARVEMGKGFLGLLVEPKEIEHRAKGQVAADCAELLAE